MSDPGVTATQRALAKLKRAETFGAQAITDQACEEGAVRTLQQWERELPGDIDFLCEFLDAVRKATNV